MAQRPGSPASRLRAGRYAGRDQPVPPSVFELMEEPVDATVVASIDEPVPEPDDDDTGGSMERDRWHLLITIGVIASLVVGLVGIGVGVAALNKSQTPPPPVPSAVVLYPSNGAKLSGTAALDVQAIGRNVTSVTVLATGAFLRDQQIAVAVPSLAGYVARWDTTTMPNATYQISAVAHNTAGRSGRSASISVTVHN